MSSNVFQGIIGCQSVDSGIAYFGYRDIAMNPLATAETAIYGLNKVFFITPNILNAGPLNIITAIAMAPLNPALTYSISSIVDTEKFSLNRYKLILTLNTYSDCYNGVTINTNYKGALLNFANMFYISINSETFTNIGTFTQEQFVFTATQIRTGAAITTNSKALLSANPLQFYS